VLIKVEWAGVNFIDTYFREGIYAVNSYPWTAGQDSVGVVERLPTDPNVLSDPEYKKRNYEVGQKVACVSIQYPFSYSLS